MTFQRTPSLSFPPPLSPLSLPFSVSRRLLSPISWLHLLVDDIHTIHFLKVKKGAVKDDESVRKELASPHAHQADPVP